MKRIKVIVPLLLLLSLLAAVGVSYAKYVTTLRATGTVTITAELGSITLREHKAERKTDGSYKLDENQVVYANSYTLIPGLDIPKDPHVIITDKTEIEAYLFVEVVDKTNDAITWEIADGRWLSLGKIGKNEGTVYVYTTDGSTPAVLGSGFSTDPIYILENNQITVSQELLSAEAAADTLSFYASMGEIAAGTTAAEVYGTIQ